MRFRFLAPTLVLSLVFLVCSCATRPRFNSETGSGLVPGKTSAAEATNILGAPDYTHNLKNSDGQFKIVSYDYPATTVNDELEYDSLKLTFKGEVLEGYCFNKVSGRRVWRGIDLAKELEVIKKGTSTKADVIKALDEPSGKQYCRSSTTDPLKMNNELWYWTQTLQGQRHFRIVTILLDASGVVLEVQESESEPNTTINRLFGQSPAASVHSH